MAQALGTMDVMDVVDAAVIAVVVLTFATAALYRLRRDVVGPLVGKRGRLLAFAALVVFIGWIVMLNTGGPDSWASHPAVAVSVVVLEAFVLTALIVDSVRAGRISGRHAKTEAQDEPLPR